MKTITENSLLGRVWVVDSREKKTENNETGVSEIVKNILNSRGIDDPDEIQKFLNPCVKDQMPDPFVLRNMEYAAKLVASAVQNSTKIAIFGDYDVDGITSTAIVVKYLRGLGCDVIWHLPARESEGYGLNIGAIDEFADAGAKLMISVDCGISGVKEVEYAKSRGMQVIVTDHHSPDSEIPKADAVINPKMADDDSGLDYLAGVGVAFMFLVALNRELKNANQPYNSNLLDYLDLVALGTICDTMPLVKLNRAFVATGLKVLSQNKNLGLKTLMSVARASRPSVYVAGFVIGPRLNAAGRLSSANPALELLLTDNVGTAHFLAQQLDAQNKERKDIENGIMMHALEMAEDMSKSGRCALFLCNENWHSGLMGIIAGRLKDKFHIPTCVATKCDGVINGSGRSIPNVNLGKIIHEALELGILLEGGGHAAAAGFSLDESRADEFTNFLETKVLEQLGGTSERHEIFVDAEIDASGANMDLIRDMSALAPFGQANPEPELVLYGGTLAWASVMGNNHIRGNLHTSNGSNLAFVGFNIADTAIGNFMLDDANFGRKITLCGKLKENEWQDRVSPQFIVEDMVV